MFQVPDAWGVPQWMGRQLWGRRHQRSQLCTFQSHCRLRGRQRRRHTSWLCLKLHDRVDSGSEFPGLKTTVFDHFWAVLGAYKRHTPLDIGLLSPQICTDHRGVKDPWKIGRNPPIGGKEYTLAVRYIKQRNYYMKDGWIPGYGTDDQDSSVKNENAYTLSLDSYY